MIALIEPPMIAVLEPLKSTQKRFRTASKTKIFHLLSGLFFGCFFALFHWLRFVLLGRMGGFQD